MLFYLTSGIVLGLSSGLSPGPIFALVISHTLNYGRKEGIKVAITPLITDLPIIVLSLLFFGAISEMNLILGIIALLGGIFIAYIGYSNFRFKGFNIQDQSNAKSIRTGVILNFLNPAPYIFWITIGAPTLSNGYAINPIYGILFILLFYTCMVGSKIMLAILIDRTRGKLNPNVFIWVNRIIGVILIGLSMKFFYDAFHYLQNI